MTRFPTIFEWFGMKEVRYRLQVVLGQTPATVCLGSDTA